MRLFQPLPPEARRSIENLLCVIDDVFPLSARFRRGLPRDIAELSGLLTNQRGNRPLSYLSRPAFLSAYLRFFLPWNVFRLCRLLPSLPLNLKDCKTVIDLGAGPLTFALALWIAAPDLRNVPLEFRCIDRTQTVLGAGKKLFSAFTKSAETAWDIKPIREDMSASFLKKFEKGGKRAGKVFVCAINVYNEIFQTIPHTVSLQDETDKAARKLSAMGQNVLIVEPGTPRSGEFIEDLRNSFIKEGFIPKSPCPHNEGCPLSARKNEKNGKKEKWCHFAFDTLDAPPPLLKLSELAGIPKERATLSFLLAENAEGKKQEQAGNIRILSDSFGLPPFERKAMAGRYACSEKGLILARGEKKAIDELIAGSLIPLTLPLKEKDRKTGASIMDFL